MTAFVPASSRILAGVDLEKVRGSVLSSKLPVFLQPLWEARSLLIASDGPSLTIIARGPFRQPPAGAKMVANDMAVLGGGDGPAPATLLADAAAVSTGNAIWLVSRGGLAIALSGNAANINRLLRETESASVGVKIDGVIEIKASALGRTADAAARLEETLRAAVTLAAAHEPVVRAVRVERDGRTVRASVTATAEQMQKLLAEF